MTLRIGLIGCGRLGTVHAGCLSEIEDARIVAACDLIEERAHRLGDESHAHIHVDYRRMLDAEHLDAVYIATPTGSHADIACAAAERGVPFFVEKPLALTMADGWRVHDAVAKTGLLHMVGYQWRYTNAVRQARRILGERKLALTQAEWLWTLPPVLWLRDVDLGGGQVVDQTTHLTDLCQLFGGPVSELWAAFTLNTYSDAEFHNWDGYAVSWKHAGGAVGSLHCTYALFSEIMEYSAPHVDLMARQMLLRLTLGGLSVVTPEGTEEYRNEGVLHLGETVAFTNALRSGDRSFICSSVQETLRSLALTLAATESAQTGQVVQLDDFMAKRHHS